MNQQDVVVMVVVSLCTAGFIQGLTGFGFGLVSMALLPLVLTFKEALVVVAVLNVVACATTLATTRQHFSWARSKGLIIGSCIGVPIGFYALVHLNSDLLLRGLGVLMCLFSASELFLARYRKLHFPAQAGLPVGLVSGALGGAFNIGGPPVIAYVYSQPWSKEEIIATLQAVFGCSAILRLGLVTESGLLQPRLLHLALAAMLPMLLCIYLASKLLNRVPRERLKSAVFVFLFGVGAKYLFHI